MFNDHDVLGRLQRGELTSRLVREHQIMAYDDSAGVMVALVHQYLLPSGALGASGLPDPKRLILNGLLYIVVE